MMGKMKQRLEEDMMNNPDYYNGYIDYDMYEGRLFMISRKEEILEREGKRVYKKKVSKNGWKI